MTTASLTQPLKDHLIEIRQEYNYSSLDETVVNVLINDVSLTRTIEDANTLDDKGVIKVSDETLELLKIHKDKADAKTYDDLLRERSGATSRDHGEEPIEWEPLDAQLMY
jgi:hypothetical protein